MLVIRRWRWGVYVAAMLLLPIIVAYTIAYGRLSEARRARQGDDYSHAEATLAKCWKLPGLSDAVALEELLMAVQQGDLRDESAWRSRAAEQLSEKVLILEALAKGNLAAFRWREALEYTETILRSQPQEARALWIRARANIEMQREDEALHDLELAVKSAPDNFHIRRTFGDLLSTLGFVRRALEQYEILYRQRPGDERASLGLVRCWMDEARLKEAGELLEHLLLARPQSIDLLAVRSRLALRMGEPESALVWLKQAAEQAPDHLEINSLLRTTLEALRQSDPDLERRVQQNDRLQAALKLRLHESTQDAELLTAVGNWMLRTQKDSAAVGWFYSALAQDAQHAPAHVGLAEYFVSSGQTYRAGLHARQGGGQLPAPVAGVALPQRTPLSGSALSLRSDKPVEEASGEEVHRLCAACHAYPPPESMPRAVWRKEVKQGFDFLNNSALSGTFPSLESVVLYYERRAPEHLAQLDSMAPTNRVPVRFEKRGTGYLPRVPPFPGIANVKLASLLGGPEQELLLCDSKLDSILVLKPYSKGPGGMALRQLTAPCHTAVGDLDQDGRMDLVVASLGNFFPTNDKVGKVLWLRAGVNGQFEPKTILDGVGRVADVQIADFNADQRLDLVIAVFGWRTGGQILYLENQTRDLSDPRFAVHTVDSRHGAIHVPVVDLNGDGHPDFLSLISQEHETVVFFRNRGDGTFEQEILFTAPHPSYGCSGIEVVDLDGDRDLDVLLTNGDVLDRPYLLKPYHGVQWLENTGKFPFVHHRVAAMYGAACATAADFDRDGDADIAAVSHLPSPHFPSRERLQLPSVMLFEQVGKGRFQAHVLETGSCDHFSCAAGDWDHDGRVDLAVANFAWNGSPPMSDAAILFQNVGNQ